MAIIKAVNSKASIAKAINYITKKEKTEKKLIAGKDCSPQTAIDEMKTIKELHNKTKGRQYKHYIMSFNPNDPNINIEKAHEVGRVFMEKEGRFKDHQVLMVTHIDKDHIHNHFIVNSVNMENGKKFRESKQDLEKLKEHLRELEKEYNIMPDEKSQEQGKVITNNQNKYQAIKRDFKGNYKSYVLETALAVQNSQEKAISKEDFISKMKKEGYKTNWKETSKHVTFINLEEKRVRLANLEKTFTDKRFTKEGLLDEFKRNQREEEKRRSKEEYTSRDRRDTKTSRDDKELSKHEHRQTNDRLQHDKSGDGRYKKFESGDTREFRDFRGKINSKNRKSNGIDFEKLRKGTARNIRDVEQQHRDIWGNNKRIQRGTKDLSREYGEDQRRDRNKDKSRDKNSKSRGWDME